MKNFFVLCFLFFLSLSLFPQAPPPERINYQGVLRDSSGNPLQGDFSMVFRFYDDKTGGTLLWEEIYDNGLHPPQISVSNGLFSVQLGDSTHRTAGSETNFRDVFSKYTDVYLSIQVDSDPEMTPRIKVLSSAYSQNANTLDGRNSDYFLDISSTTQTKTGKVIFNASSGDYGVEGYGPTSGGYFKDSTQSGYSFVGYGDYGISSYGNIMGGYFKDLNSSSVANLAYGDIGIDARGNSAGGYFKDSDSSGYAYVGFADRGVEAYGNDSGGYFSSASIGIEAYGLIGGYIKSSSTAEALLGYATIGIWGLGSDAGGLFSDKDNSAWAYVAYGDYGIDARGNTAGGYFKDLNNSGETYIGYGNLGLSAKGTFAGGYFENTAGGGTARVYLGVLNDPYYEAIWALGSYAGGYFKDADSSGYALVGTGDNGISAFGYNTGGYLVDSNSAGYANVGYGGYKIYGNGGVSFVQNHPYEKDKVIVYSAPEGDEVATYTRGTGRLINGQAKIKLGETFKWVTNPDIGLTVYLTPVGEWADLYVEKKATDEIIVKSKDKNSNAVFDFIVYGFRIGFEESSIVQEKQMESYIPSFKDHRERYKKYPDLRNFNALERFKNMEAEVKGISKEEIELSRAIALKEAIHEYDPEKDPPVEKLFGYNLPEEPTNEIKGERIKEESNPNPPVLFEKEIKEENKREIIREEKIIKEEDDLSCFIVYNQVEEGDVVVMNIQNGSSLVLSNKEYDPMVVGVVSREKECRDGKIYVKTSGIAYVKVDANLKGIKKGDFIVTSSNLGYGMKGENPQQGTVIGKALEDLEGGLRKIKVLLMSR